MSGAELIAAERQRQINVEGWTPEHDDEHSLSELVDGAITYARYSQTQTTTMLYDLSDWPWSDMWWKPSSDPIRNLVKAGALIAAEIDRLQRSGETP